VLGSDDSRGNVLVVTDDPDHGGVLRRWVEAAGERPVVLAGRESLWIARGDDETVDLVITDLDTDAPEARAILERMASGELFPGVPQVHVLRDLALRDELSRRDPAVAAVALLRPVEAGEFRARVRLAAEVGRLRRDRRRSSIRDDATGLPNRRYVLARLEQEFSRSRRYRSPLSLIVLDIDRLRAINRRWDEAVGDRVLREVADLLDKQCRKEDVVGRIGEDSFGFVLPGTRYRGAAVLANKLRTEAEALAIEVDGEPVEVRLSAGIGCVPDNATVTAAEELLGNADAALAEAKSRGGNRVHIDAGVIRGEARLVLVADPDPELLELAEAFLAMDDFRVVRAGSATAALEALRFRRPDLIVVDLQMEGERSDALLLDEILERLAGARVPVVGLSRTPGSGPDGPGRSGVDRLVTKPFSVSLLRHLARELVDEDPDRPRMTHPDRRS